MKKMTLTEIMLDALKASKRAKDNGGVSMADLRTIADNKVEVALQIAQSVRYESKDGLDRQAWRNTACFHAFDAHFNSADASAVMKMLRRFVDEGSDKVHFGALMDAPFNEDDTLETAVIELTGGAK